jgi:hypothetical protein
MIIRAVDTTLDIREFTVDADTPEQAEKTLVDELYRGVWPTDNEGWRISPVHIIRLKAVSE